MNEREQFRKMLEAHPEEARKLHMMATLTRPINDQDSPPEPELQPRERTGGKDGRPEMKEEPWPQPELLGGELPPVPTFDLKMLPEALRPLTEDTAERMQVPAEAPAIVNLVGLGIAAGKRVRMQPKRCDSSWQVHPNLWGALVMPSGNMKTPTLTAMLKPIREIEEQYRQEFKSAMLQYQRQKEEWDIRHSAWRDDYKAACRSGSKKQIPPRPDDPPAEPVSSRLITNDATKEKLHEVLAQNPGGMLLHYDELPRLFSQLDEMGHAGDKQFLMEMWNGHRYTVDRIGRGTIEADGCLSMLGGMTPRSLRLYMDGADKKGSLDDGLLQRFQLVVYPDQQHWKYVDHVPNHEAMAQGKATYERVLALDPAKPLKFCFDDEALQLFIAWQTELEAKVRDGTLHHALGSHLSKYRSLMPSLALLFELADNRSQDTVSLAHTQQAAEWCSFLESHARRIYAPMLSPQREAASIIGRHLTAGWKRQEGTFTARDVDRSNWSGLNERKLVREALEILCDAHWVRPLDSKANGRPSELYAINPRLKEVR